MLHRWLMGLTLLALVCGSGTGCDKLPFGNSSADVGDDFADFEDFEDDDSSDGAKSKPARLQSSSSPMSDGQIQTASFEDEPLPTADPRELTLQLPVGARFPLIKTVDQRLTQQLSTGPVVGHTRLELRLSLVVEEQQAQSRRLGVRYHRVQYSQDLGGEKIAYDSDAPPAVVPAPAQVYSGLKDNGFSFWLKPDHRIGELVGFNEFLRRCVAHIPEADRNRVLQQLLAQGNEHGVANFIDDSIGLLPNPADPRFEGKPLTIGSSWSLGANDSRTSRAGGLRCILKDLTPQTASIALVGDIEPSNYVDEVRQLTLTVRGGQCTGQCVVDRQTGMPAQSRIDRVVDMVAKLPDGTEIPQRKEVITTVTAFLDQATVGSR